MANKKNDAVVDIHNIVTMEELEDILKTNVKTIMENPVLSKKLPPILIHSAPGIGKSTLVRKVATDLGIGFVDVRLAEMESIDIRGLPSVDKEKSMMHWNAPDFWPRDPASKGIIFFDELTSAQKDSQVASYEIILDRKIGEFYKVPDSWYIVAAGNRETDRAVAVSMSSALSNRFLHFEVEADAQDWLRWAQVNDIHPSVTGYISYRPVNLFNMDDENLQRGWPSPRSWERVSQMVRIFGGNEDVLRKIVYGLVGNRAGIEFMEFYKINESFDSVLDMMLGRKPIKIPDRADQKYAMCSTLCYLVWRGKDKKEDKARLDGFIDICCEMTSDFATMAMSQAMLGDGVRSKSECAAAIIYNDKYKVWRQKHGKALGKSFKL